MTFLERLLKIWWWDILPWIKKEYERNLSLYGWQNMQMKQLRLNIKFSESQMRRYKLFAAILNECIIIIYTVKEACCLWMQGATQKLFRSMFQLSSIRTVKEVIAQLLKFEGELTRNDMETRRGSYYNVTWSVMEKATELNGLFLPVCLPKKGVTVQLIFYSPLTYLSLWQTWSLQKRM